MQGYIISFFNGNEYIRIFILIKRRRMINGMTRYTYKIEPQNNGTKGFIDTETFENFNEQLFMKILKSQYAWVDIDKIYLEKIDI